MANDKGIAAILSLPKVKKAGLSSRDLMQEQLKSLYSNEFLNGLDADQIMDLFDEMILLPGWTKREKSIKPRPDSSVHDLPIDDEWWLIKPEKPEEEA